MIERIEGAPAGVLAFRAVGKVEGSDYETVLSPAIDEATKDDGKVRLVYELGAAFEGYALGAYWEDAKLWMPHMTSWERCAVVTDHRVMGDAVRAFGPLMPGKVKVFPASELEAALAWAAEE